MAQNQSSESLRRPAEAIWAPYAALVLVSLTAGFLGMSAFLDRIGQAHRWIDVLYYDLQLFVLGPDPLQDKPGPYPVMLEFARFSAPMTTLYAAVEAGRMLFAVEVSRVRARRARGHAIVCGDTAFAQALSRQLQASGREVVDVRPGVDEYVTKGEPLRVVGDARDPEVLRHAGIEGADEVYVCTEGSAENAAVALAVRRARARAPRPLAVHAHIADPDLCATFQAAALGRTDREPVHIDFFNISQIAAREVFADRPLPYEQHRPPRLMVAGTSGFGKALVAAAAWHWRTEIALEPEAPRLPITLVGADATAVARALTRRYPYLARTAHLTPVDDELLDLLSNGSAPPAPDLLYVCDRREEQALKTAIAAERTWTRELSGVLVRLDRMASTLERAARHHPHQDEADAAGSATPPAGLGLLGTGTGLLRPFSVISAACRPRLIQEDLVERLAQVIHERYREGRRQRREWAPDDPALAPWAGLSPHLQAANRAQAQDIGRKLAQVNCTLAARFSVEGDAVLSAAELELLARQEHRRWRCDHESKGWVYAPARDEHDKHHPGLRGWDALPAAFQERSRDAVRELSGILSDAGFRIVRC